ncbi:parathymosin [Mustela erminea]|uniref:parathymosin n=1 Tax=Mustela erminea TaxID=36723 RepID=UPI001386A13C|nr:parathymosin [Mustela erminea]
MDTSQLICRVIDLVAELKLVTNYSGLPENQFSCEICSAEAGIGFLRGGTSSAVQGPSVPALEPRLPASPGPGTTSEKSVEAAAELSAKDLKEKKEKVEEKASRKERKKEVVEEEENGAEEEEEETAEDGEEEDEGAEEDEEEEEDDDEGPALKRAAEEEDEADPKRQKTENGASA